MMAVRQQLFKHSASPISVHQLCSEQPEPQDSKYPIKNRFENSIIRYELGKILTCLLLELWHIYITIKSEDYRLIFVITFVICLISFRSPPVDIRLQASVAH